MSAKISKITIRGYKSICELDGFEPRQLNVLIGPNAAGKSNFISFFRMLSWMLTDGGSLQEYVIAQCGGAHSLLYDGAAITDAIEAEIRIETESGGNDYRFLLTYTSGDTLTFLSESYRYSSSDISSSEAPWIELGGPHVESQLIQRSDTDPTARTMRGLLQNCIVHQFHNTSRTSRMKQRRRLADNRQLKEDAGNIAPFLLRLRDEAPACFRRIQDITRLVFPAFGGFELEPEGDSIRLKWRERGTDEVFAPEQASDGLLRAIALIALLGQPEQDLPGVLILDEPELGLHPSAIQTIAGMIQSASETCQVFAATQSPLFVDQFEPEDVVVVERPERESLFKHLDEDQLREWLVDYSLGELWMKHLFGGVPHG